MEADVRQPGPLQELLVLTKDDPVTQRPAAISAEDEIVLLPGSANRVTQRALLALVFCQYALLRRRQVDCAPAVGLRLLEPLVALELALDRQRPAREVDIVPLEAKDFALAGTG
jgi:hypothetical protein